MTPRVVFTLQCGLSRSGRAPSNPTPANCGPPGAAAVLSWQPSRLPSPLQDETALRGSDGGGQAEVSPRLVGQPAARSTAGTTASLGIKG